LPSHSKETDKPLKTTDNNWNVVSHHNVKSAVSSAEKNCGNSGSTFCRHRRRKTLVFTDLSWHDIFKNFTKSIRIVQFYFMQYGRIA